MIASVVYRNCGWSLGFLQGRSLGIITWNCWLAKSAATISCKKVGKALILVYEKLNYVKKAC